MKNLTNEQKLADVIGKKATLAIGFISHISFFVFCLVFLKIGSGFAYWKEENHIWSLFIMAAVWGIGDAVWNTLGSVILGYYFTEQTGRYSDCYSNKTRSGLQ